MSLFKKKTREEKVQTRINDVFVQLTSTVECEFTELEMVQISNEVRRKLNCLLKDKKSECMAVITANNQKINEINEALGYLE